MWLLQMDGGNHRDCEQRWDRLWSRDRSNTGASASETVSFAVVSVDRDKVSLVGEILLPLYQRKLLPLFGLNLYTEKFQKGRSWCRRTSFVT